MEHQSLQPDVNRGMLTQTLVHILDRRDLVELERKLIPLLNQVREMLGKRPVIVPKDQTK